MTNAPLPADVGADHIRTIVAIRETGRKMARAANMTYSAKFREFISYMNDIQKQQIAANQFYNQAPARPAKLVPLGTNKIRHFAEAMGEEGFPTEAFMGALALILEAADSAWRPQPRGGK